MTTTVRMLVSISGTRDGADWPARGGLATLPDEEAAALVLAGMAEIAARGAVSVETASLEQGGADVEQAADAAKPAGRATRKGGAA